MKTLNEKIMAGVFVVSVIGFLIAPCCWTKATRTGAIGIISCSGSKTGPGNSLQQKNNLTAKNTKNNKH